MNIFGRKDEIPPPDMFSPSALLQQAYRAALDQASHINRSLVRQYYQAVDNYNAMAKQYWSDEAIMSKVVKPVVPTAYGVSMDESGVKIHPTAKPICEPLPLWKHKEQPLGQVVFGQEVDFPVPGSFQASGMLNGQVRMTTVPPGSVKQRGDKSYRLEKFNGPVGYVMVWVPMEAAK